MGILELVLLFIAGVIGGVMNSIAGGGSFVTFPALMLSGVPPVMANASNTLASTAGYLSGAYAFKDDIAKDKQNLSKIILFSVLGGGLGAWSLMTVEENTFLKVVPWLLLFATVLFIVGPKFNQLLQATANRYKHASQVGQILIWVGLLVVATYGGFFNAGLGIISLSFLVIAGYRDINVMNGVKLLISCGVSLTAIVIFIVQGAIDWHATLVVLVGTLVGGYYAAHISRRLPQIWVKNVVIAISVSITVYFFYSTYL
ncbi:permease [Vibrio breoganii]|uniref:sulfite exporter TauE/SafE family protein n=1 Tax=Vibrio breoganii TaxID=553239 RepID=UPI00080DAE32|nr:sulfite exporter TauE/SafE family protein [Vibrio breoganii]OCH77197.1 permease [Vibrio breoganii]PMG35056.1 permease [Vibrio breoganii]PMG91726.1 permease [Vibrio breoganii]PMK19716.1 permease [Vibrio breoganii]PMK73532.1 permease [Vibrio breoganii]